MARVRTFTPPSRTLRQYFGKRCPYCGRKMKNWQVLRPSRDHIVPRSMGGGNRGVLVVCTECNGKKGDMCPAAWVLRLHMEKPTAANTALEKMALALKAPTPVSALMGE